MVLFYINMKFKLPPHLRNLDVSAKWLDTIIVAITNPIPTENLPDDDFANDWAPWRVKHHGLSCLYYLLEM